MLKFDKEIKENDYGHFNFARGYVVYRNNKLINGFNPVNEDTIGDKKWSKEVTKNAIEVIEYFVGKLTLVEKKQLFDFFYKGATIDLKNEIKEHKAALKKLEARLKRMQ